MSRYIKLRRWIRGKWFDWINRQWKEEQQSLCMCGDYIDHDAWDAGHSPVESWGYVRDQYVREGERK